MRPTAVKISRTSAGGGTDHTADEAAVPGRLEPGRTKSHHLELTRSVLAW